MRMEVKYTASNFNTPQTVLVVSAAVVGQWWLARRKTTEIVFFFYSTKSLHCLYLISLLLNILARHTHMQNLSKKYRLLSLTQVWGDFHILHEISSSQWQCTNNSFLIFLLYSHLLCVNVPSRCNVALFAFRQPALTQCHMLAYRRCPLSNLPAK